MESCVSFTFFSNWNRVNGGTLDLTKLSDLRHHFLSHHSRIWCRNMYVHHGSISHLSGIDQLRTKRETRDTRKIWGTKRFFFFRIYIWLTFGFDSSLLSCYYIELNLSLRIASRLTYYVLYKRSNTPVITCIHMNGMSVIKTVLKTSVYMMGYGSRHFFPPSLSPFFIYLNPVFRYCGQCHMTKWFYLTGQHFNNEEDKFLTRWWRDKYTRYSIILDLDLPSFHCSRCHCVN